MGGGGENSGLLCGRDGEFKRDGRCAIGEWCDGPYKMETATVNYQELCFSGM